MSNPGPGWYQASDGQSYPSGPPAPGPVKKSTNWIWLIAGAVVLLCVFPVGAIGAVTFLGRSAVSTFPATATTIATGGATTRTSPAKTSTTKSSTTKTSTTKKADVPAGEAAGRSDNPAPIGTEVTPVDNWTVKVNSAQLDANDAMAAADPSSQPNAGQQFVLINVTVNNNSSDSSTIVSELVLQLATPKGVKIPSVGSCSAAPPDAIDSGILRPGDSATGNICVQAPSEDAASSTLFTAPLYGLSQHGDSLYLKLS